MCGQFGLELGDLAVELTDDAYRSAGGRGERGSERRWCSQLCGAQRSRDLLGAGIDVALTPTVFEGGSDLGQAQMSCLGRSGSATEDGQGIAVVQVVEGIQRGWVVLTQC
jgi:hypothetical protein